LPHGGRRGFTLVEVLAVAAIVAILAALAVPAWNRAGERARAAGCVTKLKTLGLGIQLYSQDHDGDLPRSFHSAGAHREPGWAASIAPYLGAPSANSVAEWKPVFNRFFRCPSDSSSDPTVYSYGLNVFYELTPDGDDYEGSPATWRRLLQVPHPSKTILLAETRPVPFGDHFMCHQWSGTAAARNAVSFDRHAKKANFLFADGHVDPLLVETTFAPLQGTDLWNPSKAR
jgi:prepilin-type N-terminal cleavage/methylation domain-containing protein/prepilin-type processing-associated H-X9-DG protein